MAGLGAGNGGDGAEGDNVGIGAGGRAPGDFVTGEVRVGAGVPDEGAILNGGEGGGGEEPDRERQERADH